MVLTQKLIKEIIKENEDHECPGAPVCVRIVAIANLPSRFGQFQVVAFQNNKDHKDHAAFLSGDVFNGEAVPVRLHSECLTGDVVGSLKCDCRDQLETSLCQIGKSGRGILLYLRQEGRGIGFANKIKAYALQESGLDTVEANLALGFDEDKREYDIAAHMLWSLKVKSIKLLTNNPKKIRQLTDFGIKVIERVPLVIQANEYNRRYLETKQKKSAHLLGEKAALTSLEQLDQALVEGNKLLDR